MVSDGRLRVTFDRWSFITLIFYTYFFRHVMWTYETAVFTIATVCLFAKPTLDEPTFTPICFTISSAYAPNDESGGAE